LSHVPVFLVFIVYRSTGRMFLRGFCVLRRVPEKVIILFFRPRGNASYI